MTKPDVSLSDETRAHTFELIRREGMTIEAYAQRCAETFQRDCPTAPEWQVVQLKQDITKDLREYATQHNIVVA